MFIRLTRKSANPEYCSPFIVNTAHILYFDSLKSGGACITLIGSEDSHHIQESFESIAALLAVKCTRAEPVARHERPVEWAIGPITCNCSFEDDPDDLPKDRVIDTHDVTNMVNIAHPVFKSTFNYRGKRMLSTETVQALSNKLPKA